MAFFIVTSYTNVILATTYDNHGPLFMRPNLLVDVFKNNICYYEKPRSNSSLKGITSDHVYVLGHIQGPMFRRLSNR